MKSFIWGDNIYTYDERFWEEVVVPYQMYEEAEEDVCLVTLHYIGPIVDGRIVAKVPDMPTMYRTFRDCVGLREPPVFDLNNCLEVFAGCKDLDPSVEWHKDMAKRGGVIYGFLFDECDSPKIYGYREGNCGDSITSAVLGEDITGINNREKLISVLGDVELEEGKYSFIDGKVVEVCKVSKSSEVVGQILGVTRKVILAQDGTMVYRFYALSDSFEINEPNEKLYKVFGYKVMGGELKVSLNLGENNTLECSGETVVESACCLNAYGELRIHGSGTLILKGKTMHPCIGPRTDINSVQGWWKPSKEVLQKIIIDGVRVVCLNSVPNFSLGSYGRDDVPKVCVLNGGSLECVEMTGERIMVGEIGENGCFKPVIYKIKEKERTGRLNAF